MIPVYGDADTIAVAMDRCVVRVEANGHLLQDRNE